MPWERPGLKTLYERIGRDFSGHLQEGAPLVSPSVESVLAKIWAGACYTSHGFLDEIFAQAMIDSSTGIYLERWAAVWGFYRGEPSAAAGYAVFSAGPDTDLASGTTIKSTDTGTEYIVTADAAVTGGTITAHVEAIEAGASGNLPSGSTLSLAEPVSGVQSNGSAPQGLSGGADAESDDYLKERLLTRLRNPPRGGSKTDFELWALEVPGVTRAWCYPLANGLGTVALTFVTDDSPAGPIPGPEMVQAVKDHITPLLPATVADFEVFAPELKPVQIIVSITPDTEAIRSAVIESVKNYEQTEARPDTVLLLSKIHTAVGNSAGLTDFDLLEPVQNVAIGAAEYPSLEVSFSAQPLEG